MQTPPTTDLNPHQITAPQSLLSQQYTLRLDEIPDALWPLVRDVHLGVHFRKFSRSRSGFSIYFGVGHPSNEFVSAEAAPTKICVELLALYRSLVLIEKEAAENPHTEYVIKTTSKVRQYSYSSYYNKLQLSNPPVI